MSRSTLFAQLALLLAIGCAMPAAAAMSKTPSGKPNATEAAFVARATSQFMAKYPTAADAVRGGFYQMTGVESDGTSIYFNGTFSHVDPQHPNFLWYDRHGKLAGLDYEYDARTFAKPPGTGTYPVLAARWVTIDVHIHFAYRTAGGKVVLRGARAWPGLTNDPITAAQLRHHKLLPAGATLLWAHYHPKAWDLGFWLVPNPNGAFADLDPLVK